MHRPVSRLAEARLYLCTDARRESGDLAEFADAALAGGVDIIQLRDKGSIGEQRFGPLETRDELAACEVLADAARRYGALFAVNDRADIARAVRADVLHLGQGDLPSSVAREIVGVDTLIGLSTHDAAPGHSGAKGGVRGLRLFLRRPLLAHPDQAGPGGAGPQLVRTVAALQPAWAPASPGSPSGVSTRSGCPTCWMPVPAGLWWCARSPRPRIHARRPNGSVQRL